MLIAMSVIGLLLVGVFLASKGIHLQQFINKKILHTEAEIGATISVILLLAMGFTLMVMSFALAIHPEWLAELAEWLC